MLGTNTAPQLPAGLEGPIEVVSVANFVEAAEKAMPGFEKNYKFLCDFSHPTFMHSFCNRARFDFSWQKENGPEELHHIMDRVVKCAESAVGGIKTSAFKVYTECVPAIEAEIALSPCCPPSQNEEPSAG